MNKRKIMSSLMSASLVLLGASQAWGQSPYFQAVTNLNPAGYWPMHEVEAPAPGDIETNYGTLGLLGTGYYPDWVTGQSQIGIKRQVTGALAGDPDPAIFLVGAGGANTSSTTNSLLVPHTSPFSTLTPPFSVECWFAATNTTTQNDIWAQSGFEGLNAGASGAGNGKVCGIRLYWNPGFVLFTYANSTTLNTMTASGSYTTNTWYHVVVTDDGTNINILVNGNVVATHAQTPTWYLPDSWTPFQVGSGRGNTRGVKGFVDEVAIYTNVLPDISAHYAAGTSTNPSPTYFQLVTNDNPAVYFRMDAQPYTAPAVGTWPVLTNFGGTAANGVYNPGTMPGIVSGPANNNGLAFGGLAGATVAQFSGVSSFADAGFNAAYNPVGAKAFSVSAMFRGNPVDNRLQTIVGHSSNSWQVVMNTNGTLKCQLGTNTTSVASTAKVYNDGLWHHMVEVYTPASVPTVTGTNQIFVDGVLDGSVSTVSTNGIGPGTNLDVLIASDPQFTNSPAGVGRQFSGQVCEVAVFTNALTSAQVAALYNALGVPPSITQQPISATVNQNSAFTNTVVATGGQPFFYQWFKDNLPLATQTNSSLVLNPVKATDASTNYFVVVSNAYAAVTSIVVTLNVQTSPAIVSQLPVPYTNQFTLFTGVNPVFSVVASGATPLSYQWVSNGVSVVGATRTNFAITNVPVGLLSVYCVVTNVAGSATSAVSTASVVAQPTTPYPQLVIGDHPLAYWRLDEPDDQQGDGNSGAIANDYAGGNDGIYTNVALGISGYSANDPDTAMAVGTENTNFSLVTNIMGLNFAQPTNSDGAVSVEAWVNGARTGNGMAQFNGEGILCYGYGNGGEQICLDTGGTSNSFRFYFRDAAGAAHTVNGNTNFLSADGNWHHVVGVLDGVNKQEFLWIDGRLAQLTTLATNGLGVLAENAPTNRFTIGWRNNSTASPTTGPLQFLGDIDEVSVYNYALSSNQVLAHYTSVGVAPTLAVAPPASVSVNGGGVLTLPAAAIGTPPLSYTWIDLNGGATLASGSTNGLPLNGTLTISNIPGHFNGDTLQLTVSNAYGSTNFSVALTVFTNAPVITLDLPPVVEAPSGKLYTYSVGVVGPAPYSYQWYNINSPVAGQTNSTYTLAVGSVGSSSTYFVVITNIFGATTSSVSTLTAVAQLTNGYASAVLQFNPAGYWPLQETNAPAPATMETNFGTLGALGNAYYAITTNAQSAVQFGQSGALGNSGDNDPAVHFTGPSGTNYAFVPRISPATTLRPPFTMETWVNSTSLTFSDLISESGNGLNASAGGGGNWGGPRLCYAGNNGGGPALQLFIANGNGATRNSVSTPANSLPVGVWHHCVGTYDGTNTLLYIDGVLMANDGSSLAGANTMAIDTWTPLTIGDGLWEGNTQRAYTGTMDEVAVYTYLLSSNQVNNHYLAGTMAGSNYAQTVLGDTPLLYYRMDCAGYTNEIPSLYPIAVNYGSASVNGDYQPAVTPGGTSGPPIGPLGSHSVAAPINGILSCVDAGNDPSFNPTGKQPFTALTWFRGYPADVRSQAMMGHGATNWALNLDGTTGRVVWNTYNGGQVTSANVLNDGSWHLAAGVVDGTNSLLYVDGQLNASAPLAGTGLTSEPGANLYLGGDSAFNIVGNNQRYFGGAIAQAAFFTNALTAAQIQQIFNAAATPTPTIHIAVSGNNVVITYTGILRSSATANGPYSVVAGAISPYTVSASGAQQFYRASSQ